MATKPAVKYGAIALIIAFITIGDQFLPDPLKTWSTNIRTAITQPFVNFVNRLLNYDPSEQRQDDIDQLENPQ